MNPPNPVSEPSIDTCLRRDQHRLRRERDRLRAERMRGNDVGAAEATLAQKIGASTAARAARAASIPALSYPEELPVSQQRDEIRRAIEKNPVVILCGETGSGKTTQLPKICLEAGRGVAGVIGHTQPRRIAARAVGARIAEELKTPLGQLVGYKLRFQDHSRPEGLIKLMTDGILLAETQGDRFLDAYDTIIIDEAHERSLNIDFLLGYLKWLLPKRPDLKLIITSATIDPERFSRHFGDAPIINVSGRSFPVEVRYRPVQLDEEDDETASGEQDAILYAVDELWREQAGDILVFLSGEREIRETAESLRKHHPQGCEVLPLYSRLSQEEQLRVFRPSGRRRVVLATNVAETSLTVPGIRAVIDTGVARISRYSHRTRLQRLPIEKISQASASQRSGRCGRVGPGVAIRLYSEEDFLARPAFTEPEIQRTNLAAVILQMHALKLGDIEAFPFVEPPDGRLVRDGQRTLRELGALSEEGQLTDTGRRLAKLPLDPRLGRILLAGAEEHCLEEVAIIAAALSVPDPRDRPPDRQTQADQKHAVFRDEQSDFLSLLKLWRACEEQRAQLSRAKLRGWCKENFLSYLRLTEWHDVHGQVMEVVKGELAMKLNAQPGQYASIHRALLAGLLSQVANRREQAEYLGANGTKIFIHPGSGQFKAKPAWIVSAEQVETTKVYARNVARVEPAWIEQAGAHLVKRQHYEPHWERRASRAAVYERVTLFGLLLSTGRSVPYEQIDPGAARELFIKHAMVHMEYAPAPFMAHNLKLLEDTEYLQQKGRRVDLLGDETQLYAFFDARIPAGISTGAAFERWRREAEAKNPKILWLTEQDISPGEAELDAGQFPDHLSAGPLVIQLRYRFEPGHEDDGVSALIPLHVLNQLPSEAFEWLVPGLLDEKIEALVRSLPKNLRVHFVPVPDAVQRVLPLLDRGRGSLYAQLADALLRTGGVPVPRDAFREDLLPPHLRMNFVLLDDADKVIARSRSLGSLRERHAGASQQHYAKQSQLTKGAKTWVFGDLPEKQDVTQAARAQTGYPALVDEGESVGLRVFATPGEARISHERGCTRLIRLVMARDFKSYRRDLPVNVQGEIVYRSLTPHPQLNPDLVAGRDLREDLLDRIVMTVFLEGQEPLRSEAAFEARIAEKRGGFGLPAQEVSKVVQAALERLARIQAALAKAAAPTAADIRTQLAWLVPAGFLLTTPRERLQEFPRYLHAIEQRLEKLGRDPRRDAQLAAEIAPIETRYRERVRAERGQVPPGGDEFRWMLEEFRVSLFAQALGTRSRISARRLQDAWVEREQLAPR
jgi:ATP-dependent helicase HrpA